MKENTNASSPKNDLKATVVRDLDLDPHLGNGEKPPRTRERCSQAARRVAARGEILVTQDSKIVDPSFAKGVLQLKLPV